MERIQTLPPRPAQPPRGLIEPFVERTRPFVDLPSQAPRHHRVLPALPMKTRRFVSASLGLAALLFAASPCARAAGFDLTGTTVSSTLQVGEQTFTKGFPTPLTVADGGYPTELGTQFVSASLGITFDVYDDTSSYLYSDHQGVLFISYTSGDPEGPPYTLQAGVSFVITFNFASPGAQTITGFEFVQGSQNLLDGFTSQFDAATSTLTLTSVQDIDLTAINQIEGRFLAIPEPASFALLAALPVAVLAVVRRNRRR